MLIQDAKFDAQTQQLTFAVIKMNLVWEIQMEKEGERHDKVAGTRKLPPRSQFSEKRLARTFPL